MKSALESLLRKIERKLDWGGSATWTNEDFENLHQLILEQTTVSLSSSTLRRIWGRVDYNHDPSTTTLNTLAKFGGFVSWRDFLRQSENESRPEISVMTESRSISPATKKIPWITIISIAGGCACIAILFLVAFKPKPVAVLKNQYSFSSKPVVRGIPNSVIFTYDAGMSSNDSIFIQQSWDSRTLTPVAKEDHQWTSIYFEPGFYQAKLIVGKEVVKEHPLLIPTNGWLGIITNHPVPVYLDSANFIYKDSLHVSMETIGKSNIPMSPEPAFIKYFNVGNFPPISVSDFSFSASVKNEFRNGAAACQLATIILITDDGPVFIPLAAKGCVSELGLYCLDHGVSGKKADLSAFGVDFSSWVHVVCKSDNYKIRIYVNDVLAHEAKLPSKPIQLLGMSYVFQGTGAVKNIEVLSKGKPVFHAF